MCHIRIKRLKNILSPIVFQLIIHAAIKIPRILIACAPISVNEVCFLFFFCKRNRVHLVHHLHQTLAMIIIQKTIYSVHFIRPSTNFLSSFNLKRAANIETYRRISQNKRKKKKDTLSAL